MIKRTQAKSFGSNSIRKTAWERFQTRGDLLNTRAGKVQQAFSLGQARTMKTIASNVRPNDRRTQFTKRLQLEIDWATLATSCVVTLSNTTLRSSTGPPKNSSSQLA
jgi:hypothetical protein